MVRISKEPEKRRQELIDAAKRLFMIKGYEQTAVSDIVKEVNVAQGTFYYHFKSKIEILEEVVKKSIFSLLEETQLLVGKKDIDAVTKLNEFLNRLVHFGSLNTELSDFIHQESNLMIHDKLGKITIERIVPLLSKIIQEGVSQGVFTVTYPVETARFLFLAITEIFHDPDIINHPEQIERARITVEQSVARTLGIKEGSFRMNF